MSTSNAEEGNVREWIIVSRCINTVVSGSSCPCESGQWMSNEQECDQQRLLGVSLSYRRGPDVPLPAHTHLSALRLPLNGTLALDHLLFLHAWVALGLRGKNADHLSPLFSLALWCLKCDCSWIVAAFSWRFWHEKQAGLSGLSHGQWSRTKTISRLTVGYYYQGEWGTKHRGFLSHEIHFSSKFQTQLRCVDWIIPSTLPLIGFNLKFVRTVDAIWEQPENTLLVCLHWNGQP